MGQDMETEKDGVSLHAVRRAKATGFEIFEKKITH